MQAFRTFRVLTSRCAAIASVAAGAALAQGYDSEPAALFVPDEHVPLSEFATKLEFPSGAIHLHVKPEILTWVSSQSGALQIAVRDSSGSVSYDAPDSVNSSTGEVTYTASTGDVDFTVVCDLLVNDFPIVTHWDSTLNEYTPSGSSTPIQRGGQSEGAADGITTMDLDQGPQRPTYGQLIVDGDFHNTDPNHALSGYGQYHFATNLYAIFSDGTETTPAKDGEPADADVPAFERYIAENYSDRAVTDLAAVWLSDRARFLSGYPIVHRNPRAFEATALPGEELESGLPAFEIVHAWIVDIGNAYPSIAGSENSLGTFILPPGWESGQEDEYPIMFSGYYDIHGTTFSTQGLLFLEAIGNLVNDDPDRRAIGVLWNGGGAGACETMQRSAYDNASALIEAAQALLGGDPFRMVITGGSRGGTTALEIASNPFDTTSYAAQFVVAETPQMRPGEALDVFYGPTHMMLQEAAIDATGFKDGWKSGWTHPDTGLAGNVHTMEVFLGETDPAVIDANLAADSDTFIGALAARGTKVVLRAGTHDISRSFLQVVHYVDHLRSWSTPVPVHFEISHRFGHTYAFYNEPTLTTLMGIVFGDTDTVQDVDEHYKPDPNDPLNGLYFDPSHFPLVYEAPMVTGMGQEHVHTFVGPPGAEYELWMVKIDDSQWLGSQTIVQTGTPRVVLDGTLSADTGDDYGTARETVSFPVVSANEGFWQYWVRYKLSGSSTWEETLDGDPSAFAPPTFFGGEPLLGMTSVELIGWKDISRTGGLDAEVHFALPPP